MTVVRIIAGTLLGAVLLVGICVYMQPMMSDCPVAHPGILCPMHDTRALSFWQQAMVLSRRMTELTAIALVLLVLWFAAAIVRRNGYRRIFYERLYLPQLSPSYLQELFSQGILHPKIF